MRRNAAHSASGGPKNGIGTLDSFPLFVRLTPRGGRDAIDGWAVDPAGKPFLKARVAAPPVEGAANDALIRLLAKKAHRPPRDVRIEGGEHGRLKQVSIAGLNRAEAEALFGALPSAPAD